MRGSYCDTFEIHFMVEHSCGHDRQRLDGLNVNEVNVGYGGSQRIMHDSKLLKMCLGEFTSGVISISKENDTQRIVFRFTNLVPYDMPSDAREALCNGDVKGKKWINKTYADIRPDLWLKLQTTLPADEEKGEFTFLDKVIHFDEKK